MNPTRIAMRFTSVLLLVSFLVDLLLCPHSKVEESFQLQATYDLFYHGIRPVMRHALLNQSKNVTLPYDHLQYPGVVPRTFTGPLILAAFCRLVRVALLPILDIATRPMLVQFFARFTLLLMSLSGWIRLARAVDSKGDRYTGSWLLLVTACQFHMPFYASRMLPNVLALVVVLHSYAYWVQGKIRLAAVGIVFGTAVFRCDLLLLLGSLGLAWLLTKKMTIVEALQIGILTGIASLLLTVPMDSLLWLRWLWPEGEVFYFNTILGKSSAWGTSPWHWYFTSALPKSMVFTLFLAPLSKITERLVAWEQKYRGIAPSGPPSSSNMHAEWLQYLVPTVGFVMLYSFLSHKEMRFIFPALPIFNLAAATGMSLLTNLAFPAKNKTPISWVARLGFLGGIICIALTWGASFAFVAVSRWNYPGGDALLRLTDSIRERSLSEEIPPLYVHIDVASAMSGVSLFSQRAAQTSTPNIEWIFDKGGYEEEHALGQDDDYTRFTHLLSESKDLSPEFVVLDTIQGAPSFEFRRLRVLTQDSIFVLERKGWGNGKLIN